MSPKGLTFIRCLIARALAARNPMEVNAAALAAKRWGAKSLPAAILKASVPGGGAESGEWGAELSDWEHAAIEFVEVAQALSIIGKMQGLRRVPGRVPVARTSTSATAYWRGESKGYKLTRMAFDRTQLKPLSVGALMVVATELLENNSPQAEAVLLRDMARAVAEATDAAFVDPANAGLSDVMPAAVTHGASALTSTGVLADDLAAALAAFTGDLETASWVMHPKLAASIALRSGGHGPGAELGARGGQLVGLPAICSQSCTLDTDGAGSIALVDAGAVVFVDDGADIATSNEALVEMTDAPTGAADTPVAASVQQVSLFQTHSVGLKTSRRVNWELARSAGSVVVIENALYTGA